MNIFPARSEKAKRAFRIKLIVIAIAMIGIVATAAAVTLFTHTFPAITSTSVPNIVSGACTTLTPSQTSVSAGSTGTIRFSCGTSAAITPQPGPTCTNIECDATPTFTLPNGYTGLSLVAPHVSGGCTFSLQTMTSGTFFDFATANLGTFGYDYCASFANAPAGGLATFTVEWNQ